MCTSDSQLQACCSTSTCNSMLPPTLQDIPSNSSGMTFRVGGAHQSLSLLRKRTGCASKVISCSCCCRRHRFCRSCEVMAGSRAVQFHQLSIVPGPVSLHVTSLSKTCSAVIGMQRHESPEMTPLHETRSAMLLCLHFLCWPGLFAQRFKHGT